MPFPLIGAALAVGRKLVGGTAKKLAGKALRWATRGRLIGSGGGAELGRRAAQAATAVATVATAAPVIRAAAGAIRSRRGTTAADYEIDPATGDMVRQTRLYRRMNPLNARALRRAVRRLEGAEKVFKKVFRFNHGKAPVNVRPKG